MNKKEETKKEILKYNKLIKEDEDSMIFESKDGTQWEIDFNDPFHPGLFKLTCVKVSSKKRLNLF